MQGSHHGGRQGGGGEEDEEGGEGVCELHGCRDGWKGDAKLASWKSERPSLGWRPAAVCAWGGQCAFCDQERGRERTRTGNRAALLQERIEGRKEGGGWGRPWVGREVYMASRIDGED